MSRLTLKACFLTSVDFFEIAFFEKKVSENTSECQPGWVNIMGPDLGPNVLQTIAVDDTNGQKVKAIAGYFGTNRLEKQ